MIPSSPMPAERPLALDVLDALRYLLRDRRILIAVAAAVVIGGAVLNWSWLVAIGIAPIILALLPCAAMCALGLCMMPKGSSSCAKDAPADDSEDRKP